PAVANTPSSESAISSDRRLVSTSTPTQITRSTPEDFAVSTATAGSTSIRNRWQWVSTAPDWTDSSGFFSPIGRGTYPVSTSGEQGELHVKRRWRSEEHTSELQSRFDLVCRLLLEK